MLDLQPQILKSWRLLQEKHFCLFVCFWPHSVAWGILVPWPGIEPVPLQWKHRVLTTGPPGNSQDEGFWVWGRGLTRAWKQEWPLRTDFMLNPNPLLPSPVLPKCSPIFFHLIFKSSAGETGSEKTQSLSWRKRKIITCLVTDFQGGLIKNQKAWKYPLLVRMVETDDLIHFWRLQIGANFLEVNSKSVQIPVKIYPKFKST